MVLLSREITSDSFHIRSSGTTSRGGPSRSTPLGCQPPQAEAATSSHRLVWRDDSPNTVVPATGVAGIGCIGDIAKHIIPMLLRDIISEGDLAVPGIDNPGQPKPLGPARDRAGPAPPAGRVG